MKKLLIPFLLLPFTGIAQVEFSANYGLNTASGYETKGTISYTLLNTIKAGVGYEYANFKTDLNDLADPAKFPFVFVDYVKKFTRSDIYAGISYGAYRYADNAGKIGISEDINSNYWIHVLPVGVGYSYRFYKAFSATIEGSYNFMFYYHAYNDGPTPVSYSHYEWNYASLALGIKYTLGKSAHKAKSKDEVGNNSQ